MHLLASFPFLRLYLLQAGAQRALEAEWLGYVTSAQLRPAITAAVQLAQQHHVTAWVADDRLLGPVHPEDLAWVSTEVIGTLIAGGLRRMAVVEAVTPLSQRLIQNSVDQTLPGLPIELRRFTELIAARTWALQ